VIVVFFRKGIFISQAIAVHMIEQI